MREAGNEGACTWDTLGSPCPCAVPAKGHLLALRRAERRPLALWMPASHPHSSWLPPRKSEVKYDFCHQKIRFYLKPPFGLLEEFTFLQPSPFSLSRTQNPGLVMQIKHLCPVLYLSKLPQIAQKHFHLHCRRKKGGEWGMGCGGG